MSLKVSPESKKWKDWVRGWSEVGGVVVAVPLSNKLVQFFWWYQDCFIMRLCWELLGSLSRALLGALSGKPVPLKTLFQTLFGYWTPCSETCLGTGLGPLLGTLFGNFVSEYRGVSRRLPGLPRNVFYG